MRKLVRFLTVFCAVPLGLSTGDFQVSDSAGQVRISGSALETVEENGL